MPSLEERAGTETAEMSCCFFPVATQLPSITWHFFLHGGRLVEPAFRRHAI